MVYDETKKGTTDDGNKYKKHYFKYNHSSGDGTSLKNARFKCGFEVTFPQGVYFDKGKKNDDEEGGGGGKKFPKLTGKAVYDFSNPEVFKFGDAPSRGAKNGWVREKDVESTGYEEFEAKEDIPYFEDADDEKDPTGTIPAGTKLKSNAKEDEFYQVTFGGGGEGIFYRMQKQTAKLLWKNRKVAGLDKNRYKSEKDVLKDLKMPFKFKTDEHGKPFDKQDWYMKISHQAKGRNRDGKKVDGFLAKFEVPGVGDMTLDEMMEHSITGKVCFTFVCVYEGSDKLAMQIYTGSCVVSDLGPVERTNAQQEEVDELAADAEFVARMAAKLGPRKGKGKKSSKDSRFDKKKGKKGKSSAKSKKQESEDESDSSDDSDEGEPNVKSFVAPTMEKVADDEDSDESDSDDEVIKGIPPKAKGKKKAEADSDEEEEEPVPKSKAKKGKGKKPAPPSSDDEEEEEPAPKKEEVKSKKKAKVDSDSDDDEEEEAPPPKKEKAKKPTPPPSDDEEEEEPAPKKEKAKKPTPPPSDDEEEEEPAPKKEKAKSKKKAKVDSDDDDDEEEEEAPPPKKGKSKSKSKSKKKAPPPSDDDDEDED